MIIPIDFVAGSHGNFLETILNKYFGIVAVDDTFTSTGTSHRKSSQYTQSKMFDARHWFELYPPEYLDQFKKIISIQFDQSDLLLLSSVSLSRAADLNIDNNMLEVDTRNKLNNKFYSHVVDQIDQAYTFLDRTQSSIPRNVLREFFKFGFRDPSINGFWIKQLQMRYPASAEVFVFKFKSFYDVDQLVQQIKELEKFLDLQFAFSLEFYEHHKKFLSFIPHANHKAMCDDIINQIKLEVDAEIPPLTLFQESYINGNLERLYHKEMPFSEVDYFKSTGDMLNYIKNRAPAL